MQLHIRRSSPVTLHWMIAGRRSGLPEPSGPKTVEHILHSEDTLEEDPNDPYSPLGTQNRHEPQPLFQRLGAPALVVRAVEARCNPLELRTSSTFSLLCSQENRLSPSTGEASSLLLTRTERGVHYFCNRACSLSRLRLRSQQPGQ